MTEIQKLLVWVRQRPRLKAFLLPIYIRMMHVRYQIRNLLTRRRPIVFEANHKHLKLYPEGCVAEVLYSGNFEAVERDFVTAFLKPGMTVVDAGANIGLYTIMASTLVTESGRVHAFEPSTQTFERLLRNLELNSCHNVVANRVALSNTREQMLLRTDPQHPELDGHRFVEPMGSSTLISDEIVEIQTLDDYFLGREAIDFMKIDVEGAELGLLLGAQKTIQRSTNITILLECTQNRQQVRDILTGHGFECFVWDSKDKLLKPVLFDAVIASSNIVLRRQRGNGK